MDFHRQLDIFNPEKYSDVQVEIIGAGGIGSFVAPGLAKLGLKKIRVWDADLVEPHNLPNQFHLVRAIGFPKVSSVKCLCKELADTEIMVENSFWEPGLDRLKGIVVAAVDHIRKNDKFNTPGREELWESLKTSVGVELLIDARIGGQTIRLITLRPVADVEYWKWYERQMFADGEEAELPCTNRAVIDVGFIVGGLIINTVRRYLTTGKYTIDMVVDLSDGLQVFYPEVIDG